VSRATYLHVGDLFNLNHACRAITDGYGCCVYLVGSSLERADYRDVDVRAMLDDAVYDRMFRGAQDGDERARVRLLNVAVSAWLSASTSLPVDFQFQRQSAANLEFNGRRHALGIHITRRAPGDFVGEEPV
jgi:hypothetical protein